MEKFDIYMHLHFEGTTKNKSSMANVLPSRIDFGRWNFFLSSFPKEYVERSYGFK